MQGQEPGEVTVESTEQEAPGVELQTEEPAGIDSSAAAATKVKEFDWLAIGIVLLIAALFALAARLHPQPETSLTPAALLSATGCGLLVTAIRKLRTFRRPGLFEAAVGGLFLALFQFIAAITYPNVFYALSQAYDERLGFLTTWAMIGIFSVVASMVGAALGHLAFAPLRPLPNKASTPQAQRLFAPAAQQAEAKLPNKASTPQAQRSLLSYLIAVLLLGLAPTLVGYVFSAAFDYMLRANLFLLGPYPTLRLLSTLLPWQVPISFNLGSHDPNSSIFLLWQLWRIPLFLGNSTMFDVQALEPYVFNGAALAFLLLTTREYGSDTSRQRISPAWPAYLLLECLLGLLLVLPADLWIVRGLQGLLQGQIIATPLRTLYILDQTTFTLNLVTGPLLCVGIAILLLLLRRAQIQVPRKPVQ